MPYDQIVELCDELDAADATSQGSDPPTEFPYRQPRISVAYHIPDNPMLFRAPTRSISLRGLKLFHSGFLYEGVRCSVQLITLHGNWTNETGVVRRCRLAKDLVHEITIELDQDISVENYALAATTTRVLIADDDPVFVRLVEALLREHNTWLDTVNSGADVLEKAMAEVYDLVLLGMDMPVVDGRQTARKLREAGYTGVIVGITDPGCQEEALCQEAGCDESISKPINRDVLSRLMDRLREEPLISSLSGDPELTAIVDTFLDALPARIRCLESCLTTHNPDKLKIESRALLSTAGGYGFEPITESAAELLEAIGKADDWDEIEEKLKSLVKWCRRAISGAVSRRKGSANDTQLSQSNS